jgi:hypothetical protein
MISEYYLSSDIIKLCEAFCNRVISTNMDEYSQRKQSDKAKVWNDIFYGKLAEWGVYFIYLERGRSNINPPDMNIYDFRKKSFDADLKYGLFNLHIKSQTYESAERYGDSWMFQAKDPLLDTAGDYDIMIGCRVALDQPSEDSIEGALVQIKLEKKFRDLVIGEPRLSKFYGNKKTIYLKENNE